MFLYIYDVFSEWIKSFVDSIQRSNRYYFSSLIPKKVTFKVKEGTSKESNVFNKKSTSKPKVVVDKDDSTTSGSNF